MSQDNRTITEEENDTQCELAAWEMLDACRQQLATVTKERDDYKTRLEHIANISHTGGLLNIEPLDALTLIRKLNRDRWNPKGTEIQMRERLAASVAAAKEGGAQ